jgi:hypothetical protein
MYLRFVIAKKDQESTRALGIFHAFIDLRDDGRLYSYEVEQHDTIRRWFNAHLPVPTPFHISNYRRPYRAICWFRDSADEHLKWAWWMAVFLENHHVPVRLLKTDRVGYVVYQDEFQVAAEPYAETRC